MLPAQRPTYDLFAFTELYGRKVQSVYPNNIHLFILKCEVCGKKFNNTLDLYQHKVLTCFEGRLPSSSENKLQLTINETILA